MSVPYATPRWPRATATTVVWALAAASVVVWGLRLAAPSDAVAPPPVASAPQAAPDPAAIAQVLGAVRTPLRAAAAPDAASRFVLLGVVADADQQGAALIAVDGKPPRPFRVGAEVASGYVLQSLDKRAASLGGSVNSAPALTLELPVRPLAVNTPPLSTGLPPVMAPPPPPQALHPSQPLQASQPPQPPPQPQQQPQPQQPQPGAPGPLAAPAAQ